MSLTFRHVAPAGAPIRARDLRRWIGRLPRASRAGEELGAAICARFDMPHCFLTSTGRAGLTIILQALRATRADRDEVVIPGYTCYSVAASIVKAGLRPRVVDVDPATLDFAFDALDRVDTSRVLAVVATTLYGAPGNLSRLQRLAQARGVYLVDDAAQAMGARMDGRLCGTFGDVGLFSLDKGKSLSAIDGGVIVTRSADVAAAILERVASLPASSALSRVEHLVKLAAYVAFLRPSLYGIPKSIPALNLGVTRYTTDFPLTGLSSELAALGATMLGRLDEYVQRRRANAARIEQAIREVPSIQPFVAVDGAYSAAIRLPVLVRDPATRPSLVRALVKAGIGASASYPGSIADIPELADRLAGRAEVAGARYVAERIVTLPTHPFVTQSDIEIMADTLRGASRADLGARVVAVR